jgi:hypothetical protein
MEDFYTEICQAKELADEKMICQKYQKDYQMVRKCINIAMKIDMMSSNTDIKVFHQRIIDQLKSRGL